MFKLSQDNNNDTSSDIGAVVLEKDPEVKEPPSYQVILINDDYTPMEFVVFVLQDSIWTYSSKINRNNDGCPYKR